MRSTDITLQPQHVKSPTAASGHSSVNHQVMDQFTQIKTILSSFLQQMQETKTHTAFCNYPESEVEGLEENDFQTFRNKVVKLLCNVQRKAEKHGRQLQQAQQQTLPRSSSATLTFVPQTFQQPQQPAPAARECILTIPETQMPLSQVIQPAQQSQQQQSRGQPTPFLVIDDQKAGASRPLDTVEALQPSISCPCYRRRKPTQHIRTFKLLWKSSICDQLPTE